MGLTHKRPVQVELLRKYSQPSLLADLLMIKQLTSSDSATVCAEAQSPASRQPVGQVRQLEDRLTTQDIAKLVMDGRDGVPMIELARQFAISRSSVKRILKAHGIANGRGNYKRT